MTTQTAPPPVVAGLDLPVAGRNLEPGTLAVQLGDGPALLVFLRHPGCCFCRELVRDLRRVAAREPGFPRVVLVHPGGVDDVVALLGRLPLWGGDGQQAVGELHAHVQRLAGHERAQGLVGDDALILADGGGHVRGGRAADVAQDQVLARVGEALRVDAFGQGDGRHAAIDAGRHVAGDDRPVNLVARPLFGRAQAHRAIDHVAEGVGVFAQGGVEVPVDARLAAFVHHLEGLWRVGGRLSVLDVALADSAPR